MTVHGRAAFVDVKDPKTSDTAGHCSRSTCGLGEEWENSRLRTAASAHRRRPMYTFYMDAHRANARDLRRRRPGLQLDQGTHMCGGAVTVVTTARATSSGSMVLKCRWIPKRCQCGKISVEHLMSQPSAKPVSVGPTRTIEERIGKPSHSIASVVANDSSPAFDRAVRPEIGPRVRSGVGRDEHDVARHVPRTEIGRRRASLRGSDRGDSSRESARAARHSSRAVRPAPRCPRC